MKSIKPSLDAKIQDLQNRFERIYIPETPIHDSQDKPQRIRPGLSRSASLARPLLGLDPNTTDDRGEVRDMRSLLRKSASMTMDRANIQRAKSNQGSFRGILESKLDQINSSIESDDRLINDIENMESYWETMKVPTLSISNIIMNEVADNDPSNDSSRQTYDSRLYHDTSTKSLDNHAHNIKDEVQNTLTQANIPINVAPADVVAHHRNFIEVETLTAIQKQQEEYRKRDIDLQWREHLAKQELLSRQRLIQTKHQKLVGESLRLELEGRKRLRDDFDTLRDDLEHHLKSQKADIKECIGEIEISDKVTPN